MFCIISDENIMEINLPKVYCDELGEIEIKLAPDENSKVTLKNQEQAIKETSTNVGEYDDSKLSIRAKVELKRLQGKKDFKGPRCKCVVCGCKHCIILQNFKNTIPKK